MHLIRSCLAIVLAVCIGPAALAGETRSKDPIKHIGVYVTPYYSAALTPEGTPEVAVAREFDARLASNMREDIVAVRDALQAKPQLITPMTFMVLAIRLYDVGLRDESVFWFYVAKNRYFTMVDVLNMKAPGLSGVSVAVRDFAVLAGPFINSYAFCDFAKQEAAALKAIDWVENYPYEGLFMEQLPSLPGDRAENLKKAIAGIREGQEKEREYLADPKNREEMTKQRKENNVPEQYCWST
ncbi:hypothetical protein [Methylobacillus flagellatus]|uniref:hypothetical protein n=1 Tax=Methylobacillus flagellatus TaxID=405 RepID=UPI0010F8B114|nr:hypothetical protein [Methylobacillus flagellatus]